MPNIEIELLFSTSSILMHTYHYLQLTIKFDVFITCIMNRLNIATTTIDIHIISITYGYLIFRFYRLAGHIFQKNRPTVCAVFDAVTASRRNVCH